MARFRVRPFLDELSRRHVWRTAAVYAAAAFVAVEAADLFFPRLGLPDWSVTVVVRLAVVGFPVALLLAWIFEVGPGGVRRTEPEPGADVTERARRVALVVSGGVLALAAGAGWWVSAGGGAARPIDRVAVLPLTNLMGDPSQEYLVQGVHDRLISELQQAGVEVIARTSVLRYAGGGTPIRQIATELGVDAVIEGSVFRTEDSVTIHAGLVDGVTERYLWRESYAGLLSDLSSIHAGLARSMAGQIRQALVPGSGIPPDPRPVDPAAYEAYLRGEFHLQRFTPEDNATARGYFERAIGIDSTYAPAWVGLAKVWRYGSAAPGDTRRDWKPALDRALELDPDLAEAHFLQASVLAWTDWNWEAAAEAFERAVALNPSYAEGRMFYGHLLAILGRPDEAIRHAEMGLQLDPLNPFIRNMHAVLLLTMPGRIEEAIRMIRETLADNPGAGFGKGPLAATLSVVGRHEEALDTWKGMFRESGDDHVVASIEESYREGGARGAYRAVADLLAAGGARRPISPIAIASLYVHAGAHEPALNMLERAFDERDSNIPYIGIIPALRPLHDHPRFQSLTRRVNVPVQYYEG